MSVIAYIESRNGQLSDTAFELISYASNISEKLGKKLKVIHIGEVNDAEIPKVSNYGAEEVFIIRNEKLEKGVDSRAYAYAISELIKESSGEIVLFSNNNTSKAIAPRIAIRLSAGYISGINGESSSAPDSFEKNIYSGKLIGNFSLNGGIKVLSLNRNSFGLKENPKQAEVKTLQLDVPETKFGVEVLETNVNSDKILLTEADIVVSGGRGMKGPEYWQPLEDLASVLGAATACSRPVSDEGWRPHEEHTGQTGKILAPKLYFALGISGAIQHLAGISASKCIVAINKDKDAPIFEAADYGIIGDVHEILPNLTSAFEKIKS